MPTTDPSEGFSGLQQWSEPLIFDRLFSVYVKLISDDILARALTRLHAPGLARAHHRRHVRF